MATLDGRLFKSVSLVGDQVIEAVPFEFDFSANNGSASDIIKLLRAGTNQGIFDVVLNVETAEGAVCTGTFKIGTTTIKSSVDLNSAGVTNFGVPTAALSADTDVTLTLDNDASTAVISGVVLFYRVSMRG